MIEFEGKLTVCCDSCNMEISYSSQELDPLLTLKPDECIATEVVCTSCSSRIPVHLCLDIDNH